MPARSVSTFARLISSADGCHPSSIGSLSFSNMYLISVLLPSPWAGSPKAPRISAYSSRAPDSAKVALKSGFVAAPYAKRWESSLAATSYWRSR